MTKRPTEIRTASTGVEWEARVCPIVERVFGRSIYINVRYCRNCAGEQQAELPAEARPIGRAIAAAILGHGRPTHMKKRELGRLLRRYSTDKGEFERALVICVRRGGISATEAQEMERENR